MLSTTTVITSLNSSGLRRSQERNWFGNVSTHCLALARGHTSRSMRSVILTRSGRILPHRVALGQDDEKLFAMGQDDEKIFALDHDDEKLCPSSSL